MVGFKLKLCLGQDPRSEWKRERRVFSNFQTTKQSSRSIISLKRFSNRFLVQCNQLENKSKRGNSKTHKPNKVSLHNPVTSITVRSNALATIQSSCAHFEARKAFRCRCLEEVVSSSNCAFFSSIAQPPGV